MEARGGGGRIWGDETAVDAGEENGASESEAQRERERERERNELIIFAGLFFPVSIEKSIWHWHQGEKGKKTLSGY